MYEKNQLPMHCTSLGIIVGSSSVKRNNVSGLLFAIHQVESVGQLNVPLVYRMEFLYGTFYLPMERSVDYAMFQTQVVLLANGT